MVQALWLLRSNCGLNGLLRVAGWTQSPPPYQIMPVAAERGGGLEHGHGGDRVKVTMACWLSA